MNVLAELVLKSYKPLELEEGMLFINKIVRTGFLELFELEEIPEDEEKFITLHGYPVEPYIIMLDENNSTIILATPDQIGWWYEEEDNEYRDLYLEDLNCIINDYEGMLEIVFEEEEGEIMLIEDKVLIKFVNQEEEE